MSFFIFPFFARYGGLCFSVITYMRATARWATCSERPIISSHSVLVGITGTLIACLPAWNFLRLLSSSEPNEDVLVGPDAEIS